MMDSYRSVQDTSLRTFSHQTKAEVKAKTIKERSTKRSKNKKQATNNIFTFARREWPLIVHSPQNAKFLDWNK